MTGDCQEKNLLEAEFSRIFSIFALQERINDKFAVSNKDKISNGDGIYINYKSPNKDDYAALTIDNTAMKIGVKEPQDKLANKLKSDLRKLGLKSNQQFTIEKIQ